MQKGAKPLRRARKYHRRTGARSGRAKVFLRSHAFALFMAVLILGGVAAGAYLARQAATAGDASYGSFLTASFSSLTAGRGFLPLLCTAFFNSSLLLILAFLCGLCAAGAPGFVAIPIFKGLGLGFSMGYLYTQYAMRGLWLSALGILPEGILTSVALIIACREGFDYSIKLACVVLPTGKQFTLWEDFLSYCGRFLFCFLLALAGAVLQALLIPALSGYLS